MIKIFAKAIAAFFIFGILICVKDAGAQANMQGGGTQFAGLQGGCGTGIPAPTIEFRTDVGGSGQGFIPLGAANNSPGILSTVLFVPAPIIANGRAIPNNYCLSQRTPAGNSFNNSRVRITLINNGAGTACLNPTPNYIYEIWSDNATWAFMVNNAGVNTFIPRINTTANPVAATLNRDIILLPNTQSGSVYIRTTRVADANYSCDSRIDEVHINRPFDNRVITSSTAGSPANVGRNYNEIVLNWSPNGQSTIMVGNTNGLNGTPVLINQATDIYITGPDYRSIGNTYVNWTINNGVPINNWAWWPANSSFINFVPSPGNPPLPANFSIVASAMGCPVTNNALADGNALQFNIINSSTGNQALRTQQGNIKEQGLSDEGDISINPNPASKNTTIKLPESKKNAQITVVDSKGRVVMKATALNQNTVLNISALANGTYSIIIREKNGESTTKKLIVAN